MSERTSGTLGSLLANPNTLLALVTVAGGAWLASQRLTSNRPVISGDASVRFMGEPVIDSRLWEDPMKAPREMPGKAPRDPPPLEYLIGEIKRRQCSPAGELQKVLLLPVMISGGPYSEDLESRIRSRYAIVSAFGESDYVPEDSEHIGFVRSRWWPQRELAELRDRWRRGSVPDGGTPKEPSPAGPHSIELRYEWYRPRVFGTARPVVPDHHVLLLWLDDLLFEDEPLLRLALLLEPLVAVADDTSIIGPRRSSTLRAMLPAPAKEGSPRQAVEAFTADVLKRIQLYSATPSAMDEVLVKPSFEKLPSRETVKARLRSLGFKAVHNFAATDAEMAREVVDELQLRGLHLRAGSWKSPDAVHHLVLISEWDTFFARMLSLTYQAELHGIDRKDFLRGFYETPRSTPTRPKNFHPFVYLRGLDGQTVDRDLSSLDTRRRAGAKPETVEELLRWEPDANKAEGQAQFDYLSRMGEQIEQLQTRLRATATGRIGAIGIVGSDVYDTLLILQALRARFPNVLFFTTDLDVRFLHPDERKWARNLLVASAYGLALHPNLQGGVAPFRDSSQTAQYAAALAALGHPLLSQAAVIPVRRFEVGHSEAVEISIAENPPLSVTAASDRAPHGLHPSTTLEESHKAKTRVTSQVTWSFVSGLLLILGGTWIWPPLRRRTWDALRFPVESLDYSNEDIGGAEGALMIFARMARSRHPIALRLKANPAVVSLRSTARRLIWQLARNERKIMLAPQRNAPRREIDPLVAEGNEPAWKLDAVAEELAAILIKTLNEELNSRRRPLSLARFRDMSPLEAMVSAFHFPQRIHEMRTRSEWRHRCDTFLSKLGHPRRRLGLLRKTPGSLLDRLFGEYPPEHTTPPDPFDDTGTAALITARAARRAARRTYRIRRLQLAWFAAGMTAVVASAAVLGVTIWNDTYWRADGEFFSLTSGTSAWPGEILRWLATAFAVGIVIALSFRLRETTLFITRAYRLSLPSPHHQVPAEHTSANQLWFEYRAASQLKQRFWPILGTVSLFFLLVLAVYLAFDELPFRPLRGDAVKYFDGVLRWTSFLGFLLVSVVTIDAAHRCRRFIQDLGRNPTHYPVATRRHFSRQLGRIDERYLDEWIDLQLIADLTEKIGRLVYYPSALLLLLLLSRNTWWDAWPWMPSHVVVYALSLIFALASVVIVQRAAKQAKSEAEQTLAAKVKRLEARAEPDRARNNATQAQALLNELRELHRGAFVPFWENPVVGAIFLSSGGTTLFQLSTWFMAR